jgi:PGF-CTERM protein
VAGEGDNTDGFAARLGGDGTVRWYRTYGNDGGESLDGVVAVDDGFAYAGSTAREGSSPRAWLVRVDDNGVQQFARTYERQSSAANDIVRAGDGYVIAGEITRSVRRQSDRHTDARAARLAANGNVRWTSSFGTEGNNESAAAVASVGDGYVLAGRDQPRTEDGDDDPSERRGWYAGTTSDGGERWTRTYGDRRAAFSDVVASNESLVLVGRLGQRSDADLTAVRVENGDGDVTGAFVSDTEGSAIAQRGLLRGDRVAIAGTLLGEADSQTWLLELPVPGSTTTTPTTTPANTTTTTSGTTTSTTTTTPTTTTSETTTATTSPPDTTTAPTTTTSPTASPTTDGTATAGPGGLPVPGFTVGAAVLALLAAALLAARRR